MNITISVHKERTSVKPTLIKSLPFLFISLFLRTERSPFRFRERIWGLLYFSLLFLYTEHTLKKAAAAVHSSSSSMAVEQNAAQKSLFDALYCEEQSEIVQDFTSRGRERNLPLPSLEHDLLWDDEELRSLFRKEREIKIESETETETSVRRESRFSLSRREAVVWILKINRNHGFSALTAVLAVNYLDRFLSSCVGFQRDKPWMMQLAAVACLSLAAKVEETHVPLLLDLQVEGSKYIFEAKTIQRMELLVLSSLKWRMNAVTPLSFLDHIVRRLGLKSHVHWEFLRSCEDLLLSVLPDSRMERYLPSVVAIATMLHVIHQLQVELRNRTALDYENHLLTLLKISKVQEEVDDCYEVISDVVSKAEMSGCDNESSWVGATSSSSSSCISSSSSSSTPQQQQQQQPIFKKRRVEEQQMKLPSLMNRVFVDVVVATPH